MTVGSLGLRSGSYGSLPQQAQLYNGAGPNQCSPLPIRKPPKMSLSGAREERFLSRICKVLGRRKVGMLLLLVASVGILACVLVASKDEDALGFQNPLEFRDHVWNIVTSDRLLFAGSPYASAKNNEINTTLQQSVTINNGTLAPVTVFPPSLVFKQHPCANFVFSPPPADKKRSGPRPCPVCYVPVEQALSLMPSLPSASSIIKNLDYIMEENITDNSTEGSMFGGHPSLLQRDDSFDIKESMAVHCGFVKGKKPGQGTGFDIDNADLLEMEDCRGLVVASAIFGNYDLMQQPKNLSEYTKQNACFYIFVDEETGAYMRNSTSLNNIKRVGLWRVVVVRNLPYADARRNGKVPKLLLHRLFPNARFSVWIDGKLELVVDPYQILERFLWRTNSTFAISRHYRRFDVFEEAEANKAAGKYDNASINRQIEFYKKEGLTHYSSAKLPITSDVPEGCVIIREHIPITNLFTCLWFNEVDRFTSRDQLSFSTVRDKIMSRVNWTVNMFLDCERRNFVVQAYHRDLLEQRKTLAALKNRPPPPLAASDDTPPALEKLVGTPPLRKLPGKINMRRGKRHHRPRAIPQLETVIR